MLLQKGKDERPSSPPVLGQVTQDWSGLTADTPDGGKRTWSDFMVFLNAHLPPHRRTETVKVRRL